MCGITGVLMKTAIDPSRLLPRLERMTSQVHHRGPDGGGAGIVGPAGFGHRRLSIIDLNDRAAQPMRSVDGRVMVTFNGEIYNFRELRTLLEAEGCTFRTESDTEVLLHGWLVWGEGIVRRLRGMFAFALWDQRQRTLMLARDRFGKKPLFYADRPDCLLFASEIKSMLEWPGFERKVNLDAVHDYLTFNYCLGIDSAFEGVQKVPPAHYLISTEGRPPRLERYWTLAGMDSAKAGLSVDDLAHELIERLDDAVRCRLVSDVPLGAFLSGGVDSSGIVARMASMSSQPVKTFSVGFELEGFNETQHALKVAERYGTEHHSFIMDYDLIGELPKLIWHYGEPYADSSALVTYALSREVRRHVTVALTGDGGDETFLGYARYARFHSTVLNAQAGIRRPLPYSTMHDEEASRRYRDAYVRTVAGFREEHKIGGYGPNLAEYLFNSSNDRLGLLLEDAIPADAIDRCSRVEMATYLPDDLLVKSDIASMAASLEVRSPFLDHELADWAASLPQDKRVFERAGQLELKALLKKSLEPFVMPEVLYRQKQGFSVPMRHWLRGEIREFTTDLLTSRRFLERGLFTEDFIRNMLGRHMSGREEHGKRLWQLVCLELWYRTFIDRREPGALDINVVGKPVHELRAAG